ncbi:Metallo-dependent phosphatase-like protein [Chytriomyces sp. MP71]|nr:Metallo-dependent phosphatase-like protein [Chytriomyces sp. MP71]
MVLVLVIGDLHIPYRAADLPAKFKKLLVPGKIHKVLCTGNVNSREALDTLRAVCADMTAVVGDFDDPSVLIGNAPLPTTAALTIGNVRIGLVHGHTVVPWGDRLALSAVARELDVDVLVSGHTHAFEAFESEGRFYLNPGSATGAFSSFRPLVRVPLPVPDGATAPVAAAAAAGASATPVESAEGDKDGDKKSSVESDAAGGESEGKKPDGKDEELSGDGDVAAKEESPDAEAKIVDMERPTLDAAEEENCEKEEDEDEEEDDDENDETATHNDHHHAVPHIEDEHDDPWKSTESLNPKDTWGDLVSATGTDAKKLKKKKKASKNVAATVEVDHKKEDKTKALDQQRVRTHKLVSDVIPSFALLDVQGNNVVVYVYKLIDGDVKVEKLDFVKKVI